VYLIVHCPRCGSYRLIKGQRTFKCFSCGNTTTLKADYVVATASSADEARRKIVELKTSKAARRE